MVRQQRLLRAFGVEALVELLRVFEDGCDGLDVVDVHLVFEDAVAAELAETELRDAHELDGLAVQRTEELFVVDVHFGRAPLDVSLETLAVALFLAAGLVAEVVVEDARVFVGLASVRSGFPHGLAYNN